jgi:enoyl-CoA hydratase/carnithine racemase
MNDSILQEDLGGGIALLKLNRAPVNALDPAYLAEIEDRFDALERDCSARAVVLTSTVNVFSAGLDLKAAKQFTVAEQTAVVDGLNTTFVKLYRFPKPLVVAVNGAAIAGGLFFVLTADYAVALEGVKLGLAEVRVGVNFPIVPLEIARGTLTPRAFRQLLLSGNPVPADQALLEGIVDEVVSANEVLPRAQSVARDYAKIPPIAYRAVKTQMRAPVLSAINAQPDPTRDGWFTEETVPAMESVLGLGGK